MASGDVTTLMGTATGNTGIPFDCTTTRIEDGCSTCGASGTVRYSTISDYRRFIQHNEEQRMFEEDGDYMDRPEMTGTKVCKDCGGKGWKEGNGPLITMRITATRITVNSLK